MISDPHPQDDRTPERAPETDSDAEDVGQPAGEAAPSGAEAHEAEGETFSGESQPRAADIGGESGAEQSGAEQSGAEANGSDDDAAGQADDEEEGTKEWYIVKVQVNREDSIRRALERRVKLAALERYFGDIVVPTEDVAEFNKSGKRRVVKKKLYPGYIMINLVLNDETWFLVRETPGIGDFTGSAGKPTPMEPHEVQRIITTSRTDESGESPVRTAIPFKPGDRVRVKEGYFENFEGDVEAIDDANGRVTIMINIFGRSTPVELEHWQVESV